MLEVTLEDDLLLEGDRGKYIAGFGAIFLPNIGGNCA